MALVAARRAERNCRDDVDEKTKWWNEYPRTHFSERARPEATFTDYMGEVFSKPKRYARSASLTNLTYIRETPTEYPAMKRTSSYSSLAPSLSLPQYQREAQRIVHTVPVYKPHYADWSSRTLSKHRFDDTHREVARPYKPAVPDVPKFQSHVPYYSFQTKRIFHDERAAQQLSYLRGSQKYLDRYVSARLRADDFANRFAYSAYEWRKPQDHAFNRHLMYDQGVHVSFAPGLPYSFYDKMAMRNMYKATGRFYF